MSALNDALERAESATPSPSSRRASVITLLLLVGAFVVGATGINALTSVNGEAPELRRRSGLLSQRVDPALLATDMISVMGDSQSASAGPAYQLGAQVAGPAGPSATRPPGRQGVGLSNPLQRLQAQLQRVSAAQPIVFPASSAAVQPWHTDVLDEIAQLLADSPGMAVTIIGLTDDTGSPQANRQLSLSRASAVRSYLISKGVDRGMLKVEAKGESSASGERDLGYLERRVDFEVMAAASVEPDAVRPLDVGVIVPSASDDLAFSQSLVDSLARLAQERGGLTTRVAENLFIPAEATAKAMAYIEDGVEVIILHGAEFLPIIEQLATDHPDVVFICGPDGFETDLSNVFVYTVAAEQGAYVMGWLATQLSASGTVGIVGPVEVEEPKRYVEGFRLGVEAHGATALSDYVGSFHNAKAAAALAERFVEQGADVLTGTAELTPGPIGVARRSGLAWFANQTNQAELAPRAVVVSQVYHLEVALREMLAEIDANSVSGGTFPLTLGNGGLLLEYNPAYPLDEEVREGADRLLFKVMAGSVPVPVDP